MSRNVKINLYSEEKMDKPESASIIIPVYNEEQGLRVVLNRLKELSADNNWEVIVVDDGSTDNSVEIANSIGFKVLRQPYNKGYGAALKAGIRIASSEILIFMDGDGQHNPDDIPKLLEEMEHYDMAVGTREKGQRQDWIRKPGKWFLSRVVNFLSGIKIPDVNCGFRSIKKKCAEEFMALYPNGFSFSTTVTLATVKAGYSIKYIPIQVHSRKGRKSTVKQGSDGMRTLLLILRCIVLFNPLKVFFPISAFLFIFGTVFTLYSLVTYLKISNSAIIILLFALIIFFFGLIADQLSVIRRSVK